MLYYIYLLFCFLIYFLNIMFSLLNVNEYIEAFIRFCQKREVLTRTDNELNLNQISYILNYFF